MGEQQMKTNCICTSCGQHKEPISITMVRDDKNGNVFFDVLYACLHGCNESRYIRYTEHMSICPDKYHLCLDDREILNIEHPTTIHSIPILEHRFDVHATDEDFKKYWKEICERFDVPIEMIDDGKPRLMELLFKVIK